MWVSSLLSRSLFLNANSASLWIMAILILDFDNREKVHQETDTSAVAL